jgi:F0F1-type ATP synthase assembly protein I
MEKKSSERLAMAMGAAQFGFLVAGGILGGLWLDRRTNTTPLFGMIGLVIGFAAGIKLILRIQKEVRKNDS